MELYDKKGKPIVYIENNEDIYLFKGQPVDYLDNNEIFEFNEFHIGWFENGWIRDLDGRCVLYTKYAHGDPIKPIAKVRPIK
ncbi:4-fold beta flower protein [Staphylococcus caprae]|uniref:4-fold beta flower protein n=1 Tax=Staphylococcus caprae TaxID=29380 RepID=UPI003B21B97E